MASMYDLHDTVRLSATFTVAGTATDPTTVTFSYRAPGEAAVTLTYGTDAEVVKSAAGVYYVDLTLDEPGAWYYRWLGTGAVATATPDLHLLARDSLFD